MGLPDELRKMAAELREKATMSDFKKTVKSAQIIQAAMGISLLSKKIKGGTRVE